MPSLQNQGYQHPQTMATGMLPLLSCHHQVTADYLVHPGQGTATRLALKYSGGDFD